MLPNFEILLELVKREALIGIEGRRDWRKDASQVQGAGAAAGKSGGQNSARGQERSDFLARHRVYTDVRRERRTAGDVTPMKDLKILSS